MFFWAYTPEAVFEAERAGFRCVGRRWQASKSVWCYLMRRDDT